MNRRAENTKKDIILPQADFNGNHTIKDISEKNLCNLDLGWSSTVALSHIVVEKGKNCNCKGKLQKIIEFFQLSFLTNMNLPV